jgi:hypothetical protein
MRTVVGATALAVALAVASAGVAAAAPDVRAEAAPPAPASAASDRAHPTLYPMPAPPVQPQPCPPPPIRHHHGGGHAAPKPKPKVRARDLPHVLPVGPRHVSLDVIKGKGMWYTTWQHSDVDVNDVVARAKAAGLTQIWVRTGGARQGWYGKDLLTRLLPVAHAAHLAVVAWDFPFFSDPMADVARARAAIEGRFGGEKIDAFSPDIETINEGTFNTQRRVKIYLSRVRQIAGDLPVVATVMRPSPGQLATYTYKVQTKYVDAFAPMVYWSCHEPGQLAADSVKVLSKLRPVHVIGQAYDMGPEGGRRGMPSGKEIWRFLDASKRAGALGASLYDAEEATSTHWKSLGAYPW